MFAVALFIIAQKPGHQISFYHYEHGKWTVAYLYAIPLAVKNNEPLIHAAIWMNCETLFWVKEALQKSLHAVLFHLY